MKRNYDVIVVGAGVMGCAAAYASARRGNKVLLLDRFQIGHTRGSSHGRSRIFRFSYPDQDYVRMAMQALSRWRKLEEEAGKPLLISTGGIDVGEGAVENARALEACGAAVEMLDQSAARQRWPFLSLPDGAPIVYSPDGAIVLASDAWRALAAAAVEHGAHLEEQTAVAEVTQDGSVVLVDGTAYQAGCVIVTAGAWAARLLADAGIEIPLRPTRETVAYFDIPNEPVPALVEWGAPSIYALTSPGQGLKVGEHIAGPDADPDEDADPNETSVERVSRWVSARWPTADPTPHHVETCFYTNTTDESFVLSRHGAIVVGSACSGHGFKFAPLIGERLADL